MLPRARKSRSLTVLALAAGFAVAGCEANLGKANFPRSTGPAASAGSAAPVDTKAYDSAVLRLIDPCSLIDKNALSAFGAPDDPSVSSTTFEECRNSVKDPGGKAVKISVQVGDLVLGVDSKSTGTIEGLPQVEDKTDDTYCTVSAVTSTKPANVGISFEITYVGGDPCQVGRSLLAPTLKKIRETPVKYPAAKGSLLALDPCAIADDATVNSLAPSAKASPVTLHDCQWTGNPVGLTVAFHKGQPPIEGDGYSKVDLDGVTGFQKLTSTTSAECTVEWQQRPWQDDQVEISRVTYSNRDANKATDDPCGKAAKLAKNVVAKLPKA
ncbi:DUF3558 domain-containing protein [Amycolatopsis sp. H20-H5]|uniref:DUF3558 domain-containing protein n=1 Tax=Amycolatopsis sp. H20-H5 TaxID=3046309 RepID=UPI002DBB8AB3|nr:DUF3558 domain-containing protein [Amycolatopsis sp. H20-H5]MEC3981221.1 DUF3558 domain-containing protein [Amycolatopsis sp. H20-H5]